MTEEIKQRKIEKLKLDTDEYLLDRFVGYVQNFNPVDYDRCDDYELVKAEVLRRMGANK